MAEISESQSSIPSSGPSSDENAIVSVNDQLSTLSIEPNNEGELDADDDGGEERGSVERESEENGEEKAEGEGGGKVERERGSKKSRFPVRSDAEDCSFYMKTGSCKFGMNCKFNHPPKRKPQMKENDDSAVKEGQIECKYFDRLGGCKYGKGCKFNHSRKSSLSVKLNFMGLPIRLGEKECPYYMRNGSCKFGANCRFNHPDPTSVGGSDTLRSNSIGGSFVSSSASPSALAPWSPADLHESPSYVPLIFPPTQGVPSQPDWNCYQAPVYPLDRNMQLSPTYAMNSLSPEGNVYTYQKEQIFVDEYPERPGQPECSYYMKTGNCKYRTACKFHHPKIAVAELPSCTLSDLGLPLRPGVSVCSYYSRYGICKYGPECKYDHPVNYNPPVPLPISAVSQSSVLSNSLVNEQAMAAGS